MWDISSLRKLRLIELEKVIQYFSKGKNILEIGAGNGWQALELERQGYDIKAIDTLNQCFRAMREDRVFPVIDYDGFNIPYPNESFNIVFSSNVLEHIQHDEKFQMEIKRVLKFEGIAIHILPTATWRFWTTIAHYLLLIRKILCSHQSTKRETQPNSLNEISSRTHQNDRWNRIWWWMIPERHGEKGNFITEIYYFSRWRWRSLFRKTGFRILHEVPTNLFYSGFALLGNRLSLQNRKYLSHIFGSSCRAWILKPLNNGIDDGG